MAESGELNGDERFEVESSSETCDVGFAASTGFSSGQLPETTFAPAFGLGISNCTTSDVLQLTTTKSELGIYGSHYGSQCASNISSLPSTSFPSLSKPPATSKTLPVSAASGFNISTSYPPSSNVGFAASTGFSSGQLPETTFAPAFGLGISNCTTSDLLQLTTTKSELGIYGSHYGSQCPSNISSLPSTSFPSLSKPPATSKTLPVSAASGFNISTSYPPSSNVGFAASTGFSSGQLPETTFAPAFGLGISNCTTSDLLQLTTTKSELGIYGSHYGSQCASNISSLPSTSFPSLSKPPATSKTLPVSAASGFNISTSYPPSSNVGFAASTGFSSGQLPETTFAPAFGLGISNCTTSDLLQLTTTKSELGIYGSHYGSQCASNISSLPSTSFPSLSKPPATSKTLPVSAASGFNISTSYPPSSNKDGNNKRKRISETETDDFSVENSSSSLQNEAIEGGDNKKNKEEDDSYDEVLFVIDTNQFLHKLPLIRKLFEIHEIKAFTFGNSPVISSYVPLPHTSTNPDGSKKLKFGPPNARHKPIRSNSAGFIKKKIGIAMGVRLELDKKKQDKRLATIARRSTNLLDTYARSKDVVTQSFQEFEDFKQGNDSMDLSILKFCMNLAETRSSSKVVLVSDDKNFHGIAAASFIAVLNSYDLKRIIDPLVADDQNVKFVKELREFESLKNIFRAMSEEDKNKILQFPRVFLKTLMDH